MALVKNSNVVRAREAGAKVRNMLNDTSSEVSQLAHTVETRVNEKPVQSSLIALGIGFVLGALLSRR